MRQNKTFETTYKENLTIKFHTKIIPKLCSVTGIGSAVVVNPWLEQPSGMKFTSALCRLCNMNRLKTSKPTPYQYILMPLRNQNNFWWRHVRGEHSKQCFIWLQNLTLHWDKIQQFHQWIAGSHCGIETVTLVPVVLPSAQHLFCPANLVCSLLPSGLGEQLIDGR